MGVSNNSTETKVLLREKVEVMSDFGLTDKKAVRAYLETQIGDAPNTEKTRRKLDTICNHLITKRLDGDYTFVKKG